MISIGEHGFMVPQHRINQTCQTFPAMRDMIADLSIRSKRSLSMQFSVQFGGRSPVVKSVALPGPLERQSCSPRSEPPCRIETHETDSGCFCYI